LEKPFLLIAEDEPFLRERLCVALEDQYRMHFAYNGLEVVNFLKEREADIILLDTLMPLMNGIEVLYWMKENNIKIPVILMSSFNVEELIRPFNELKIVGIISKPFSLTELHNYLIKGIKRDDKVDRGGLFVERRIGERRSLIDRRKGERRSQVHIDPFLIVKGIALKRRGTVRRKGERRTGIDRRGD
jgi:CheY-like chemotaxis protein